ncbi:unnamed protein product [Amoebophrya sp. A25]|nr:unnamed protein product [Amoebophrya sp. A25]|eukprot:GSA25T00005316001.1
MALATTATAGAPADGAKATVESAASFQVMVTGELEGAQLGSSGRGPLMCVFSFQSGHDWTVVQGTTQGITQLACSAHPTTKVSGLFHGDPREVVWNFPIGVTYKSTNAYGWPRLIVSVYGTDLCNRRVIKGYGSIHVPCTPGRHERTIRLFRPISSSWLVRFLGWLGGNPAQFVDPRIVAGTEGREVVRVQSGGKVKVIFNVLAKGHKEFNYDLGGG